ncbi:MAG: DUF3408 domain-containing protein [Clostridium sp.]|nr:DUF3408 domain-containing protein [Clostridium sp.]
MARKTMDKVNEDMLKDMMMSDIPLYGRPAQESTMPETPAPDETRAETKEKASDCPGETASKSRKKKDIPASDYRERFLTNTQASNRSHVYINREVMECIRQYLPVIAPGVSVSGYLSNIFLEHIRQHWNEINELYKQSVKPLKQV